MRGFIKFEVEVDLGVQRDAVALWETPTLHRRRYAYAFWNSRLLLSPTIRRMKLILSEMTANWFTEFYGITFNYCRKHGGFVTK